MPSRVLVVGPTDNDLGGPVRRNFFALLSLLVVCAVGAASLPATAAERYPVSYNFLSSAVLAGTQMDADPPGREQLEVPPHEQAPATRRTRARHGRQQEHQLADPCAAAGQQRLLRVRADLRRLGRYAEGRRPVRRPRQDRDERAAAGRVRHQGAQRDRGQEGRHPRALAGHPDAELLPEVPRRSAVRAQLRLARPAVARHRRRRHARQVDGHVRTQPGRPGAAGLQGLLADVDRVAVHAEDASRGSGGQAASTTRTS